MKYLSVFLFLILSTSAFAQEKWNIYATKTPNCIYFDKNSDTVWIGTIGGVVCMDTTGNIFKVYSTHDGLVNIEVNAIAIDKLGNKWFGTERGISKFDGKNWENFTAFNSNIPDERISAIGVDSKNNIWISSGEYISKYDWNSWTSYTSGRFQYIHSIYDLMVDSNDNIWTGAYHGIDIFNGVSWSSYSPGYGVLWSEMVKSLKADSLNNIYIGLYGKGVYKKSINSEDTMWSSENTPLSNIWIKSVALDSKNRVWACSTTQLCRINQEDSTQDILFDYKDFPFIDLNDDIEVDKNDHLWIASNSGIYKFNGSQWIYIDLKSYSEPESIQHLASDRNGNVWVISNGKLFKLDVSEWKSIDLPQELLLRGINDFAFDNENTLWLLFDDQLLEYDGEEFIMHNIPENRWDNTISFDDNNNLYIRSPEIYIKDLKFDGFTWSYQIGASNKFEKSLYYSIIDLEGNIWIPYEISYSSEKKLSLKKYTPDLLFIDEIQLPVKVEAIYDLKFDVNGILWVGTDQGLFKYDGTNWTIFNPDNCTIPSLNVQFIEIDNMGRKILKVGGRLCIFEDGGGELYEHNNFYTIKGNVYHDRNENGIKDDFEEYLSNWYVKIINDSTIITSKEDGSFIFARHAGNYQCKLVSKNNWKITTNDTITVLTSDTTQPPTFQFGVKIINDTYDMSIDLTGGITRTNSDNVYKVTYSNYGSDIEEGNIILVLDSLVSYVSCSVEPEKIISDTLIWSFSELYPSEQNSIDITLNMPNVEHLGDTLHFEASVSSKDNDVNFGNNTSTLSQIIIGSYDPNDKTEQTGIGDEGYIKIGDTFFYLIRFQNTGTDTAFSVVVRDTLSCNFNIESFKFIASSHPVKVDLKDKNVLTFQFDNIILPDSSTNVQESNGFVKFSISPENRLQEETVIQNTAYIFFDLNPPIQTNTTTNILKTELLDSDADGVIDFVDILPYDPSEAYDSDKDGVGNNEDKFIFDNTETKDSDNDGVGDNSDVFPFDSKEFADNDGDGFGNNSDIFPEDSSEWLDSDNDLVGDNSDFYPNDPSKWENDTQIEKILDENIIYPVPAKNKLYVKNVIDNKFWIYNNSGQMIMTGLLVNNSIDISALSAGKYFIEIDYKHQMFVKK